MSHALQGMAEARQRFLDLVAEVRPELHRYCTRMTGSVFDGEDVVQDTLAKAYFALAEMDAPPPLRPWLFRIAHNAAMDFVRRCEHRNVQAVDDLERLTEIPADEGPDGERVEAALLVLTHLPPHQRSALALKDVLGLSLEETAAAMGTTVPAVKAALVRARAAAGAPRAGHRPPADDESLDLLRRCAHLFNQHDWDGLRTLFGPDTELDVVSRHRRRGRAAAEYFTRYEAVTPTEPLRLVPGWADGVLLLAVFRLPDEAQPAYFIRLDWHEGRVARVRDYRFVPYLADAVEFIP